MTLTINVITCFQRQDGLWSVTYKDRRGGGTVTSSREVQPGTDVRIRDGRVIG